MSYEFLQTTWFVLWGLLWAVYFILDGFDLGMGTLMPFIAKNDAQRRIIYNAAGPFWDGNEVGLISAGGVTFAAFPKAYAVMFSALYAPLLILLFALIFRAVSFEFRNKIDSPGWRKLWDAFQFLGNAVPALLLGVAFANLFQGLPIDEQGINTGNLFSLLNVYGLLSGVFFVLVFIQHGSIMLALRTTGEMHEKATRTAKAVWPPLVGVALAFLMATAHYTPLYHNYAAMPALTIVPILAVIMLVALRFFLSGGAFGWSFGASAAFILCVTFFGVLGMFPNIIPSNISAEASVTIAEAASSPITLTLMLAVSLVCVPVVIGYQAWVYSIFSHKLTEEEVETPGAAYY